MILAELLADPITIPSQARGANPMKTNAFFALFDYKLTLLTCWINTN
jgi:hypothetical protein